MITILMMLFVPAIIAIAVLVKFKDEIVIPELIAIVAIPFVLMVAVYAIAYNDSTTDTEFWNGRIVQKFSEHVSCEHSYDCNCSTDSKGNRHCSTCYEHSYDVDWVLNASTGDQTRVDRVDRRGLSAPPRWNAAYVGEPYTSRHSYTNYWLLNEDSVLNGGKGDVERYKQWIPQYPQVYDYYHAGHVINAGVPDLHQSEWEWLITNLNADISGQKQVNILMVFVPVTLPDYALALKNVWHGGKKNDSIIVIGSHNGHSINFVWLVTWSTNAMYAISLEDAIRKIGTLDKRDDIVYAIKTATLQYFERAHMKDFEYLSYSYQPSLTTMVVMFLISTVASAGIAWFCVNNEIRPETKYRRY